MNWCFRAPLVLVFPAALFDRRLWAAHDNPLQIREIWLDADRLHLTTWTLYAN